jgi:hypothetical protein
MTDQGADIDAAPLGQRIQVIGDRFPRDIDARLQHAERDLFGVRKEFEIPFAVAWARRRDDLAALADNDRRMAVVHRGATVRIPNRLRIEMGMMVDEPGSDDPPFGVDRADTFPYGCKP